MWLRFWHVRIWIEIGVSAVIVFWFTWGGIRDLKRLLRELDARSRDDADDGFVGVPDPDRD